MQSPPSVSTVPSGFASVRTIFLDRDGVINRKAPEGEYVSRWEQFHLLPGADEAIATLNRSGRLVFLVTNQRGVALGLYSEADIDHLHARMAEELSQGGAHLDGYFFCPHDKNSCDCRKPLPGMFAEAMRRHPEARPETSVMIGDSLSDIEAGHRLGMKTIFIEGEPERRKAGAEKAVELADAVCPSLKDAVDRYLS